MPKYRRRNGQHAWHWCMNCSNWPTSDYSESEGGGRPIAGELCNECSAKEKAGMCAHIAAIVMAASGLVEGNSKDEIPSEIVARYKSIELIKNKARRKNIIYYLIFLGVVIILYLLKVPLGALLPLIGGTSVIMLSTLDSLKSDDMLFIKLYKSIEMLKLSETNPDFRNDAYKKFNDALRYIPSFQEHSFPWYSKNDDVTDKFFKNLQSLVSRGILDGHIDYNDLSEIALAFISSDINDINILNTKIDEKLGNILFTSHERDKTIKNIIISFTTSIYSSTIIKLILTISGASLTALFMYYIFTLIIGNEIQPGYILASAAGLSIPFAYATSLTKEKIFSIRDDNGWPLKWTKER